MNKGSTRHWKRPLRKLERLLLDTDVNAQLERYLVAVGFDVLFALRVGVNVHNDTAIVRWARRHRRILVTHDRFKDGKTKFSLYKEIYDNGGQAIVITGGPQQDVLTSLGKVLLHRPAWLQFFEKNDGIFQIHGTKNTPMHRAKLHRQIQGELFNPAVQLKSPKRPRRKRASKRMTPPTLQRKFSALDDNA